MRETDKDVSLEDFAEEIIQRFPLGNEAAYLIKNINMLDYKTMINHLLLIAAGKASDIRYRDEASVKDAEEFISRLEGWKEWAESLGPDPFNLELK